MWCFIDESWPGVNQGQKMVGVIAALLVEDSVIALADELIYHVKRKYWKSSDPLNPIVEKNPNVEFKGSKLLSSFTFHLKEKLKGLEPNNHLIVREIISFCDMLHDSNDLHLFSSIIWGDDETLIWGPERLGMPFNDIIVKVSKCAQQMNPKSTVRFIYDVRNEVADKLACSVKRFVLGTQISNISPYIYFGSSKAVPLIQMADIMAYIIGKRAIGDQRFRDRYLLLKSIGTNLEVEGNVWPWYRRYDHQPPSHYTIRKVWGSVNSKRVG